MAFDALGFDRVEFLIAPNPGEGLKPLVKIASGGETSRLMLALKNVLARADFVPTLIFDEIDQGIGGRVGGGGRREALAAWPPPRGAVRHPPAPTGRLWRPALQRAQAGAGRAHHHPGGARAGRRQRAWKSWPLMLGSLSEANRTAARETLTAARKRASQLNQAL